MTKELTEMTMDELMLETKARLSEFVTWKAAYDFCLEQIETIRKGGAYMDNAASLYKATETVCLSIRDEDVTSAFRAYKEALELLGKQLTSSPSSE